MSLLPTAPQSLSAVLDNGFHLYRASLRSVWPLTLAAAALSFVPSFLVEGGTQTANEMGPEAVLALLTQPRYWLSALATFVVNLWAFGALIDRLADFARGATPALSKAAAVGLRRMPPLLGAMLLFMLLIALGFALLIVPGVYWSGVYQLAFVAVIVDNAGVLQSFGISRRLIKGHWWRASCIVALGFIPLIVVALFASFAGFLLTLFMSAADIRALFIKQLISGIVDVFMLSLPPAIMLALYQDLKLRNSSETEAERAAALQTNSAQIQ